jgi:hypothetical protein
MPAMYSRLPRCAGLDTRASRDTPRNTAGLIISPAHPMQSKDACRDIDPGADLS